MAIFSFIAKLGLDTADFQAGVKRAQSAASGLGNDIRSHFGSGLKSIGASVAAAFSVAAVTGFASRVAETAGEIKDMSELLETSTDEVQRLQIAAQEADVPFAKIITSFQRIEQMKASAAIGDEKAKGLFQILGIDPSKNSIDILKNAVNASERGARENAAAFDLLGGKVVHLKRVVSELNALPKIELISEQALNTIDRAEKTANRMWSRTWRSIVASSGNALANIETAAMAYQAYAAAIPAAEALGLQGEEARRYRLKALEAVISNTEAEQKGITVDQLLGIKPEPKQSADMMSLLLRAAEANEGTYKVLYDQVRQ